jgi:hypothetical protein
MEQLQRRWQLHAALPQPWSSSHCQSSPRTRMLRPRRCFPELVVPGVVVLVLWATAQGSICSRCAVLAVAHRAVQVALRVQGRARPGSNCYADMLTFLPICRHIRPSSFLAP